MGALVLPGQGWLRHNSKLLTFTGAANLGAAGTAATVFTVTGEVLVVALVPVCTVNLTEAGATATVALGVTGSTALFVAATDSVEIDAGEFWVDTGPDANGIAVPAALQNIAITDNIIVTCATEDTDAGAIRFEIYWLPLSSNAAVA
jgi:hypothetical protein